MQQLWSFRAGKCLSCSVQARYFSITSARPFEVNSFLSKQKTIRSSRPLKLDFAGSSRFKPAVERALADLEKVTSNDSETLRHSWNAFRRRISQAVHGDSRVKGAKDEIVELRTSLFEAFRKRGELGVRSKLRDLRREDEVRIIYGNPHLEEQKSAADLRYPAEWYPITRSRQRTIHLHVGPTNSGKTYHALKRLEQAKRGFYAGPLRLLAQEVHARFVADGIPCALITGDDVRIPDDPPRIHSNTVEMVNLNQDFEVGVIDEIQMISDPHRGWAWTRAFMGARVQELHVCGEERSVPLIRELTELCGDVLEIHRYKRLNPLRAEATSLDGDLRKLRKGDCIVAFSRLDIHTLKREVEKVTGRRAAVVYGGLPAEIRTQQANLFNDPDNDYDFLVASDAIGMGLNLKCRRVIFHTLIKRLGSTLSRISIPEIKQIGGRAGRYRAANEKNRPKDSENEAGLVTSLEAVDLPDIQRALYFEPPPLQKAGVIPLDLAFQRIAHYFPPNVSFKLLVNRVFSLARLHPLFFLCKSDSQTEAANMMDRSNYSLSIDEQLTFMAAPIYERDPIMRNVVQASIKAVATNSSGRLIDMPEFNLEVLELRVSGSKDYLHELESLHKSLILYLWLSFRIGGVFTDRTLATHVKTMVEERMIRALTEFSVNSKLRRDASRLRSKWLERQSKEEKMLLDAADEELANLSNPSTEALGLPVEEEALSTSDSSVGATN